MALEHAKPGEAVRLADFENAGRTAALVKTDQFEAIYLAVEAGTAIPSHSVAGLASLLCLKGRVRLTFGGESVELAAGEWLYFDKHQEHGVEGVENSAVLLTIHF